MSKGRIKLPPLVLDGEVKVLHTMTLRELHVCLTRALRVAGGDSVEESGRSVFSIMEKPSWWPTELSFDPKFTQDIPPQERSVYYRHLLSACYSHYKQEEVLHLFDSRPGEPPRWRLDKDDDGYSIISNHTDRSIWTYSNNYQILPLITLAARQAEQYRAAIGEQLKRPRNDVCDLVIRTRRQKANPPSRNQHSFTDGSESAVDTSIVGDRNITNGSDESGHPLSPPMRPSLLPDGSPRRISIMNWSHRFPFSEFYNDKSVDTEQPQLEFVCHECKKAFCSRPSLVDHLVNSHVNDDIAKKNGDAHGSKKFSSLYDGLNLVPDQVSNLYDASIDEHKNKISPLRQRWKPQFIGCQLPLSCELGRTLFGSTNVESKNESNCDPLPYEEFCATDRKSDVPTDQANGGNSDNPNGVESKNSCGGNQQLSAARSRSKFYPIIYRPHRLVFHTHTFKFTAAERRLFIRMQQNGGLDDDAKRLLEQCVPLSVDVRKLTAAELETHGIFLDESDDESESGSASTGLGDRAQMKAGQKPKLRSHKDHPEVATKTNEKTQSASARALAMVLRKYWSTDRYPHLKSRIGALTGSHESSGQHRPSVRRKKEIRRSSRDPMPKRCFSLVENFERGRRRRQVPQEGDSSTLVLDAPARLSATAVRRNGFGRSFSSMRQPLLFQRSSTRSRRPQREHRLPLRYRSPDRHDERRRYRKKLAASATALVSPVKQLVPISPAKSQMATTTETAGSPKKYLNPDDEVAALVAKIFKKQHSEMQRSNTQQEYARKHGRPLPKKPDAGWNGYYQPEPYAPPPYSEHVYASYGSSCAYNGDMASGKSFGRFMVPRELSPETEEHMRETVNEVVEAVCYDQDAYYQAAGISLNDEESEESDELCGFKPAIQSVKQEIKEEPLDEDFGEGGERCSSESTIVSAIYEALSSPEGSDEESDSGAPSPVLAPWLMDDVLDVDAPAEKRLKMSFVDMCARPRKLWTRPPILGTRKPTILGGRRAIPNGGGATANTVASVAISDRSSSISSVAGAAADEATESVQQKSTAIENSKVENEIIAESAQLDGAATTEPQSAVLPSKANENGIVEGNCNLTAVSSDAVRLNHVPTKPVIIVSGTSSTVSFVSTTAPYSVANGSTNRTFRVPVGCRLVLPVRPVARRVISTSVTVAPSATPQTVSTAASRTPSTVFRPLPPSTLPPTTNQAMPMARFPAQSPFPTRFNSPRMVNPMRYPAPTVTTSAPSQIRPPQVNYTAFKCNVCGVELSFLTNRAWQNINYHMSMAHRQVNYRLRKVLRKRPTPALIIEAVKL